MHQRPIRVSRAGSLGRAELDVSGHAVTVLTTSPGSIAGAALAVRAGLTPLDLSSGSSRARASDRLAAAVARAAGCGVLISIGGDIATGGPAPPAGWRVRLADGTAAPSTVVHLPGGGLATVRAPGGDSAWRTVTVAAGSCREARAASVSAAARGDTAAAWIGSLGLAGRLVGPEGSVTYAGPWSSEPAAA